MDLGKHMQWLKARVLRTFNAWPALGAPVAASSVPCFRYVQRSGSRSSMRRTWHFGSGKGPRSVWDEAIPKSLVVLRREVTGRKPPAEKRHIRCSCIRDGAGWRMPMRTTQDFILPCHDASKWYTKKAENQHGIPKTVQDLEHPFPLYPLVINNSGKSPFSSWISPWKRWFSKAMLVITRGHPCHTQSPVALVESSNCSRPGPNWKTINWL